MSPHPTERKWGGGRCFWDSSTGEDETTDCDFKASLGYIVRLNLQRQRERAWGGRKEGKEGSWRERRATDEVMKPHEVMKCTHVEVRDNKQDSVHSSTMWVPGIKLRTSVLAASLFTH